MNNQCYNLRITYTQLNCIGTSGNWVVLKMLILTHLFRNIVLLLIINVIVT